MNSLTLLLSFVVAIASTNAFSTPFIGSTNALCRQSAVRSSSLQMAVDSIDNASDFDAAVASADSLVIVDYSTTWCGPCKVIAPKFDELSDQYSSAKFLKASAFSSLSISLCSMSTGSCQLRNVRVIISTQSFQTLTG